MLPLFFCLFSCVSLLTHLPPVHYMNTAFAVQAFHTSSSHHLSGAAVSLSSPSILECPNV